jgi:arylsulfatase A-like enzyme
MLTGLDFTKHGVVWNNYRPGHIPHPTVLSVASQSGLTTAMLFSKEKFHFLANPYTVNWIYGAPIPIRMQLREDYSDPVWIEKRLKLEEAAEKQPPPPPSTRPAPIKASEYRTSAEGLARVFSEVWPRTPFGLTFVHIREADEAGHQRGWMGLDYLQAVREADRAVGRIVDAIRESGKLEKTAILISADHGGSGRGHYRFAEPNRAENVTIPWICAGPGIRPGTVIDRVVHTYDTAPTALALLGLGAPAGIDGRAVVEVLR